MKWISTITGIGSKAIDNKDKMVILFGEGANKDLEEVSVIQKFNSDTPVSGFVFKKNDTITIDGQTYVANYVGPMVESNLKALAHVTLYFDHPVPKKPLANAVYLAIGDNEVFPQFNNNEEIIYEHI